MAAIAGLICFQHCSDEMHHELVQRMCAIQVHRGPDNSRVVTMGRVCLGTADLRLTDLSDASCQPMQSKDGHRWIVFDGAIYNSQELREELTQGGHAFHSNADAEVTLQAFEVWGEKCLERFRGMFAFAIYDRRTETTTLVRDHFGQKPLHYTVQGHHLFFASEAKGLLATCPMPRPNKRALVEWILYRDVMPPDTLFEGVVSIPPGHLLELPSNRLVAAPRGYYRPMAYVDPALYEAKAQKSPAQIVTELDAAIQDSVRESLTGEVPGGVMLSGGVDSSLITAIAASHKEVTAFHVSVPDDPRMDERSAAEEVARYLGVPLECYSMDGKAFLGKLAQATYHNEMPLWHMQCVAFYILACQAYQRGVKVLLSGDSIGALLGAEKGRHRRQKWLHRLRHLFTGMPHRLAKALEVGVYAYKGMPVTTAVFETTVPHMIPFLDGYARRSLLRQCEEVYSFVANPVDRAIHATKLADLSEWLLRFFHRGDRLGMGASVQYRNPFQDLRSVHMAINLPLAFNMREGTAKWGLKEVATRYIPRRIAFRQKVAWDLPADRYLAPLARRNFFHNGFCSDMFRFDQRSLEWLLDHWRENLPSFFNLVHVEIWGRLFFLNETIDQVTDRILCNS